MNKKEVYSKARILVSKTVADLKCSLSLEDNLDVLQLALALAQNSSGYGSGKTATKMIQSRIKKIEKEVKA